MNRRLPDFIIIGAMKCATTTLHKQLARQTGIVMSRPKEPNFFGDAATFARGLDWYATLFEGATGNDLLGESSTHYTKRPSYTETVGRMARVLPGVKLVYVMRDPIRRLVSHYWHARSDGRMAPPLDQAITTHPELVDYGRYAFQLRPYVETFGPDRVHPIFFEQFVLEPQDELTCLGDFLGCATPLIWDCELKAENVGDERMRRSDLRQAVVSAPWLTPLRRKVVPAGLSERVKNLWRHPATRGPNPPRRPKPGSASGSTPTSANSAPGSGGNSTVRGSLRSRPARRGGGRGWASALPVEPGSAR